MAVDTQDNSVVIVSSKGKAEASRDQGVNWGKVAQTVAPLVLSPVFGLPLVLTLALGSKIGEAQKQVSSLSLDRIPVFHPSDARRLFRFDHGHPIDGAAYLLNPCVGNHYLLPAVANERLAQEKVSAFVRIAAGLGAKTIELVSGSVDTRDAAGGLQVPLPDAATQIGMTARFASGNIVQRQVYTEFDEPDGPPAVPESLSAWLDVDPMLRTMAETRQTSKLRKINVSLKFGETLSLGAELAAKLEQLGVSVGGAYKRVATSTWDFEIEYWPAKKA